MRLTSTLFVCKVFFKRAVVDKETIVSGILSSFVEQTAAPATHMISTEDRAPDGHLYVLTFIQNTNGRSVQVSFNQLQRTQKAETPSPHNSWQQQQHSTNATQISAVGHRVTHNNQNLITRNMSNQPRKCPCRRILQN